MNLNITLVKIHFTMYTDEIYETENQFYNFEFQFYSHANGFYMIENEIYHYSLFIIVIIGENPFTMYR